MINSVQVYPILYDWISVGLLSIGLILFFIFYGAKHPGYFSLIVVQFIIFGLFFSWSNIFHDFEAGLTQPLRPDQQVYGLAPIVSAAAGTIFNIKLNFDKFDKTEDTTNGN